MKTKVVLRPSGKKGTYYVYEQYEKYNHNNNQYSSFQRKPEIMVVHDVPLVDNKIPENKIVDKYLKEAQLYTNQVLKNIDCIQKQTPLQAYRQKIIEHKDKFDPNLPDFFSDQKSSKPSQTQSSLYNPPNDTLQPQQYQQTNQIRSPIQRNDLNPSQLTDIQRRLFEQLRHNPIDDLVAKADQELNPPAFAPLQQSEAHCQQNNRVPLYNQEVVTNKYYIPSQPPPQYVVDLQSNFTRELLRLDYLDHVEKDQAKRAHFLTVLQNERDQADQQIDQQLKNSQMLVQQLQQMQQSQLQEQRQYQNTASMNNMHNLQSMQSQVSKLSPQQTVVYQNQERAPTAIQQTEEEQRRSSFAKAEKLQRHSIYSQEDFSDTNELTTDVDNMMQLMPDYKETQQKKRVVKKKKMIATSESTSKLLTKPEDLTIIGELQIKQTPTRNATSNFPAMQEKDDLIKQARPESRFDQDFDSTLVSDDQPSQTKRKSSFNEEKRMSFTKPLPSGPLKNQSNSSFSPDIRKNQNQPRAEKVEQQKPPALPKRESPSVANKQSDLDTSQAQKSIQSTNQKPLQQLNQNIPEQSLKQGIQQPSKQLSSNQQPYIDLNMLRKSPQKHNNQSLIIDLDEPAEIKSTKRDSLAVDISYNKYDKSTISQNKPVIDSKQKKLNQTNEDDFDDDFDDSSILEEPEKRVNKIMNESLNIDL